MGNGRLIPITEINASAESNRVRAIIGTITASAAKKELSEPAMSSGLFNVSQGVVTTRIKTSASDKTCRLGV